MEFDAHCLHGLFPYDEAIILRGKMRLKSKNHGSIPQQTVRLIWEWVE